MFENENNKSHFSRVIIDKYPPKPSVTCIPGRLSALSSLLHYQIGFLLSLRCAQLWTSLAPLLMKMFGPPSKWGWLVHSGFSKIYYQRILSSRAFKDPRIICYVLIDWHLVLIVASHNRPASDRPGRLQLSPFLKVVVSSIVLRYTQDLTVWLSYRNFRRRFVLESWDCNMIDGPKDPLYSILAGILYLTEGLAWDCTVVGLVYGCTVLSLIQQQTFWPKKKKRKFQQQTFPNRTAWGPNQLWQPVIQCDRLTNRWTGCAVNKCHTNCCTIKSNVSCNYITHNI